MKRKFFHIILVFGLSIIQIFSQNFTYQSAKDTLDYFFKKIAKAKNDSIKMSVNNCLIDIFTKILEDEQSFDYEFKTIKYLGEVKSRDKSLKIYTWNLVFSNDNYQYFGFVQYRTKDKYNFFFLNDKSDSISDLQFSILTNNNWYGNLYYEISHIKFYNKRFLFFRKIRGDYYVLLGWDGRDKLIDRKIIDVLYFNDEYDSLYFGKRIFRINDTLQSRVIFEYSSDAYMTLKFDCYSCKIIFDHLCPSEPHLKGRRAYYLPDGTYDAFELKGDIFQLQENIIVRGRLKK